MRYFLPCAASFWSWQADALKTSGTHVRLAAAVSSPLPATWLRDCPKRYFSLNICPALGYPFPLLMDCACLDETYSGIFDTRSGPSQRGWL